MTYGNIIGKPAPTPIKAMPDQTLEQTLNALCQYGRPAMHCHDDMTWSCNVKMNTNGVTGAEFTIRSDYQQTSPLSAAKQCLERVHGALKK